jgi:uncharacterized protein (DUF1330 family)
VSAYLIGEMDVHDAKIYAQYALESPAAVTKYGGKFMARGGKTHTLEGEDPPSRIVVVEFPSVDAAQAFYNSSDYQAIIPQRQAGSRGRLFVVEGVV